MDVTRAARRRLPPGRTNITRVDHHHFHGWHVALKRGGERVERYFHDRGNRAAALERARIWRDQVASRLPPPRKFKRRYVRNTTGVVGVSLSRERTRKGTHTRRYRAVWTDENGEVHTRSFSVRKYGAGAARTEAIRARLVAIERMLRPRRR